MLIREVKLAGITFGFDFWSIVWWVYAYTHCYERERERESVWCKYQQQNIMLL
jgi:hypothetical protein